MKKDLEIKKGQKEIDDKHFGFAKFKLNGKNIGPKIIKIEKNIFEDEFGNKYLKDGINKKLRIIYISEKEEKETLRLKGFQEGSYGIWLEQSPPYFIKDGYIVGKYEKKKAKIGDVKNEAGNEWLDEEDRIKDDFLWIMQNEEIIFPEEKTEDATELIKEQEELLNTKAVKVDSIKKETTEEDKLKERAAIAMASARERTNIQSSGSLLVVSGAKMKCMFGDKEASLNVLPVAKVFITNKPVATMMDNKPMVNITPFGMCKCLANPIVAAATAANHGRLKKMPCIPNTVAPWLKFCKKVFVKNKPAITKDSKLMCMWGGNIKITDPGQEKVKGN